VLAAVPHKAQTVAHVRGRAPVFNWTATSAEVHHNLNGEAGHGVWSVAPDRSKSGFESVVRLFRRSNSVLTVKMLVPIVVEQADHGLMPKPALHQIVGRIPSAPGLAQNGAARDFCRLGKRTGD